MLSPLSTRTPGDCLKISSADWPSAIILAAGLMISFAGPYFNIGVLPTMATSFSSVLSAVNWILGYNNAFDSFATL
jgi:hypothetical protein